MNAYAELNKKTSTTLQTMLFVIVAIAFCLIIAQPQIYFVANALGIQLAPDWYQAIVDWISSGGTIAGAFAAVLGITLPAWLTAAVAGLGVVSA